MSTTNGISVCRYISHKIYQVYMTTSEILDFTIALTEHFKANTFMTSVRKEMGGSILSSL